MTLEYVESFTDLIESLKFFIQYKTGISAERINFMIGNGLAEDNKSLYGVGLVSYFYTEASTGIES